MPLDAGPDVARDPEKLQVPGGIEDAVDPGPRGQRVLVGQSLGGLLRDGDGGRLGELAEGGDGQEGAGRAAEDGREAESAGGWGGRRREEAEGSGGGRRGGGGGHGESHGSAVESEKVRWRCVETMIFFLRGVWRR